MSTTKSKIETGAKEGKEDISSKIASTAEKIIPSSSKDAPTTSTDVSSQSLLDQTKSYATAATEAAKSAVGGADTEKPTTSAEDIKENAEKLTGKTQSSEATAASKSTAGTDPEKSMFEQMKEKAENMTGGQQDTTSSSTTAEKVLAPPQSDTPELPKTAAAAATAGATEKEETLFSKLGHEAEELADKIAGSVDKLLHPSKEAKPTSTTSVDETATSAKEKVVDEGAQSGQSSTDTTPEKKSHHTWQESLGKLSEKILHPKSKKVKKDASDA